MKSPKYDNEDSIANDFLHKKYIYTGRIRELVNAYNMVVQLLYPRFSWYIYPGYLQYALYRRHRTLFNGKYRLVPIPNQLYEILIAKQFIKSDHIIFAAQDICDKYAKTSDFNLVQMIFGGDEIKSFNFINITTDDVQINGLCKQRIFPHSQITFQILPMKQCQKQCLFVKENLYSNLIENYLGLTREVSLSIWVNLQHFPYDQSIPQIAIKAHINVLQMPYELSSDIYDLIFNNYFHVPRLIYCRHLYCIPITAQLIGTANYARNYSTLFHVPYLYFRCDILENKTGSYDNKAIIIKGCTSLLQFKHYNLYLPRRILDDLAIVSSYPLSSRHIYKSLRSSINTYLYMKSKALFTVEMYPVFLIEGERGAGKSRLTYSIAADLGLHVYNIDCSNIISQTSTNNETKLKLVFAKNYLSQPLLICFRNFETLVTSSDDSENVSLLNTFKFHIEELFSKNLKYHLIVIVLTCERKIKHLLEHLFLDIVYMEKPNLKERYIILRWMQIKEIFKQRIFNCRETIDNLPLYSSEFLEKCLTNICTNWSNIKTTLNTIATKTENFSIADLKLLHEKAINECSLEKHRNSMLFNLKYKHFLHNLNYLKSTFANNLGAPKVPKILWSDIGGLCTLKEEIQNSISLPLKYFHLMGEHLRRSGILLYGPPGTGKTLVAKAVATECQLSFLSIQGSELLNMYVGQSEQNVREVFIRARLAAPCVIFLDELDSLAPNRGVVGDSGGVIDRVVSQLLAEMDNLINNDKPIFILAATNRPDLIDIALLRPGRFDKLFYVGPYSSMNAKISLLETQTKFLNTADKFNLRQIAEMLEGDISGADIYSICSNAWLIALRRLIEKYCKGTISDVDLIQENIQVDMEDFKASFKKFIPSISKEDLEYFNKLNTVHST